MIATVTGQLESVRDGRAMVSTPLGLTFDVLVPSFAANRLAGGEGQPITLHTLAFLEGTGQGATMFPRLAGFLTPEDKAFFELFVTVKGIGHRKALRAMALPPAQIAAAIADRDVKMLQTLPEVGRRTAETIAVTLKEKVDRFVSVAAYGGGDAAGAGEAGGTDEAGDGGPARGGLAREALEVLLQLGEGRVEAMQWIDRILAGDDPPRDAQGLVTEVYRVKGGGS